MKEFLILRLINAAYACDAKGYHNLSELITEAIKEIENGSQKTVHDIQRGRDSRSNEARA